MSNEVTEQVSDSDLSEKCSADKNSDVEQITDQADKNADPDVIAQAQRDADNYKRIAQRAQADLINFRNRSIEETQRGINRAIERFALRVMDICDHIEIALSEGSERGIDPTWIEGINAVHQNILSILLDEGFKRFEDVESSFNPAYHEAILVTQTDDYPPGSIIRQLRAGYQHRGNVVRAAQVEIAASVTPVVDDDTK